MKGAVLINIDFRNWSLFMFRHYYISSGIPIFMFTINKFQFFENRNLYIFSCVLKSIPKIVYVKIKIYIYASRSIKFNLLQYNLKTYYPWKNFSSTTTYTKIKYQENNFFVSCSRRKSTWNTSLQTNNGGLKYISNIL